MVNPVSTFIGNISNAGTMSGNTGIAIAGSTIDGAIVDSGYLKGSATAF